MAYEVKGVVHQIDQEQVFASGFNKRLIIIKTDEKYAQTVPIEFFKDSVALVDKLKIGQQVTVHCNIKGSEHNGKFYCNLQGWKVETSGANIPKPLDPMAAVPSGDDDLENLPF